MRQALNDIWSSFFFASPRNALQGSVQGFVIGNFMTAVVETFFNVEISPEFSAKVLLFIAAATLAGGIIGKMNETAYNGYQRAVRP